jgi:GT2 family glycosyltransferase
LTDPIPVTILIPVYGAVDKLKLCLNSLIQFAPEGTRVYVLDDATPDGSIAAECEAIDTARISIRYIRSPENRGFVRTCNWGASEFWQDGSDLLLLNSDTEFTEGAMEEMQSVLRLHEKHAVVTPRSNNATIFSVPLTGPLLSPQDSYSVWLKIKDQLPRYTVMPTAVGFCLLVKRIIYERFGLFDEAYSPGYNEENDFVRRINRYGYSALAANRAFVFHHESSSFGARRAQWEEVNRERLLERYPEYERIVSEYVQFYQDPVDAFAALHLRHRPRILYDLFHLTPVHTGTSEFALNLLREIGQLAEDEFELYVGICQPEGFFDNVLAGYRIYEDQPDQRMSFDLLFKPCQVFSWHEFERMNRLAPRITWVLQDIIGVRCDYLGSPIRRDLLEKAVELSDCVFTISQFSQADYAAFYGRNAEMRVIYHGTNEQCGNGLMAEGEYVLLIGNSYSHKGISDALEYLDTRYPVVVVGGAEMAHKPNVRWLKSGTVSHLEMREAMAGARLLVFPSFYEGFGLPVIDALAMGKPVIVLGSQVNIELQALLNHPGLKLIQSLTGLNDAVAELWTRRTGYYQPRRWREAALEYLSVLRALLLCGNNVEHLRRRWEFLRSLCHFLN